LAHPPTLFVNLQAWVVKYFKPYCAFLVTLHCSLCAGMQVLRQQKGWDRRRWVGSPAGWCSHGGC